MKKQILLRISISLLLPMYMFATPTTHNSQEIQPFDEELYRSLVYVNKNTRESIVALNHLFPEFSWSAICQKVCHAITNEATVMQCNDIACVVDECLTVCENLPQDKVGTMQTELEKYKQLLDAGKAHISRWYSEDDVDEIVTRNFDGYREIVHLYTRLLTVDGTETINGLLTVNGIIALNGRLILNGVDVTTVIAGAVTSVSGGNNITITGTPSNPIVNVSGTINHAVQVGNATGSLTSIPNGAVGEVLTATALDPVWAPAPAGIQTIIGDAGTPVTPVGGTVNIFGSNSGASVVFYGNFGGGTTNQLDLFVTDNNANTYIGEQAGTAPGGAQFNSGYGNLALGALTSGDNNNAFGALGLGSLTSGSFNNSFGSSALSNLGSGNFNIGIGLAAGLLYTGAESSNILLNNQGVNGESNALRIGTVTAAGDQNLNKAFICGIRGITTGVADAIPVLIDSANQLGTLSSSKRFKENIVPMPTSFSEHILDLQPTLFNYIQDETKTQTWGLIAEDVQQKFPKLVVNDKEGLPFTVKYHDLPVLLLNELIKLKKEHEAMKTLFAHEVACLKLAVGKNEA